jgi:hypothetical protein
MILALICSVAMAAMDVEETQAGEVVFALRMTEFPPVSAESREADRQLRMLMNHPRFSRAIGVMASLDGPVQFHVWIREEGEALPEKASSLGLYFLLRVVDFSSTLEASSERTWRALLSVLSDLPRSLAAYPQYVSNDVRLDLQTDGSLVILIPIRQEGPHAENADNGGESGSSTAVDTRRQVAGGASAASAPVTCRRTVLPRVGRFRRRALRSCCP